MNNADWTTAIVLGLPVVLVLFGLYALHRREQLAAWLCVSALATWVLAMGMLGMACQWEGFEDGPLPWQCRADLPD